MPRLREFRYGAWAKHTLDQWVADQPDIVAFDTETTGLGFYDQPFAATLTWRSRDGELKNYYLDLWEEDKNERVGVLKQIMAGTPTWVAHNAKFDLQKLKLIGAISEYAIEGHVVHDTQTQFHLLDENSPKALKKLAVSVLKIEDTITLTYQSGTKKGQTYKRPKQDYLMEKAREKLGLTKDDGYHLLPREVLIPYALKDTEYTLLLHEKLWPRLEAKDERLQALYWDEMELCRVLLRMESDGMALDLPYLRETTSQYGVKVMEGWQSILKLTGKPDFNPGSWQQIIALFAARGIDIPDTQATTLAALNDELATALLEWRADQKLYKTYLKGLLEEQRDGLVHPWFNSTGAKTGRFSSGSAKE